MDTKLTWPIIEEDDDGNGYFECPFCEGIGIACEGDTADMGDDEIGPIMVQIGPDWPCDLCEKTGLIKENSEVHFYLIKHTIFEIIQDTFGQGKIDTLPEKKLKQFYTKLISGLDLLKPIFVKRD